MSGVEVLPAVARHAREERGLDVYAGHVMDASLERTSFDAVYLNEVLEHIVDPVSAMTEVCRLLAPDGVAIARTGNVDGWSSRLRGGRWWYIGSRGPGGHVRLYGPRAARALGMRCGFREVECATKGFSFLEAREVRGRWFYPVAKLAQAAISPLAGPLGSGQRLTIRFVP